MIYVTSDLHGYALGKFKALLAKAGFSREDFLFVLGDVIDRGPDGVNLLRWMMAQHNVELILGNHEDMMLSCEFLFEEITDDSVRDLNAKKMNNLATWQFNGGTPTINGLTKLNHSVREMILEYVSEAPLYDSVSVGGKDYLLVHSGLGNYAEGKKISEYTSDELLWCRPGTKTEFSHDFVTVFGHTPTFRYGAEYEGKAIIRDTWINVDTGAATGLAPMLLRLDDLAEFYADPDEEENA